MSSLFTFSSHMNSFFITSIFLLLLRSFHLSSTQNLSFYDTCGNTFNCGNITGIRYPFRGTNDPPYCGHPALVLTCDDQTNATTIQISSATYRVLEIIQSTQTMRIVRQDLMTGNCPQEMVNTTIDPSLFEYAAACTNFTFLYGCPARNIRGSMLVSCGYYSSWDSAYVVLGTEGPGTCNASVVVPVHEMKNGEALLLGNNTTQFDQVMQEGFQIRWTMDSEACSVCTQSNGRCGFDYYSNQTTCFCADAPYVSSTCTTGNFVASPSPYIAPVPGNGRNRVIIQIVGGTLVAGIFLLLFIVFIVWSKKRQQRQVNANTSIVGGACCIAPIGANDESSQNVENFLLDHGFKAPRRYTYSEIKKMTKSFSDKLGGGGYGIVYKGTLPDGKPVAVKVLIDTDGDGEEFINEVASISRTAHINIVILLGFCFDRRRRALIYEFMPNKSLDKFIYNSGPGGSLDVVDKRLDWETTYKIALGVARGLEYLHSGCNTRIVHFDIKPQNILLDDDFHPKISDFGLAKLCLKKQSILSMIGARGTIGYIAPEVFSRNFGGVSHKSDVYSYGMMVLEMSGARNIEGNGGVRSDDESYFPDKIYEYVMIRKSKNLDDAMNEEENKFAKKLFLVGFWCCQTIPSDRPSISKVLEMLEGRIESIPMPPKPFLFSAVETGPQLRWSSSIEVEP